MKGHSRRRRSAVEQTRMVQVPEQGGQRHRQDCEGAGVAKYREESFAAVEQQRQSDQKNTNSAVDAHSEQFRALRTAEQKFIDGEIPACEVFSNRDHSDCQCDQSTARREVTLKTARVP